MTTNDPAAGAAPTNGTPREDLSGAEPASPPPPDAEASASKPKWRPLPLNGADLKRMKQQPHGDAMTELRFTRGDVSTEETTIVRPDPVAAKAEDALTELITECHFMMKEVAFRSMCQCVDPVDRIRFMGSAMEFAKTGAEVAGAIAVLRGGSPVRETRQRIMVERVETMPASAAGEGGEVVR
jgi:hypothetical protein